MGTALAPGAHPVDVDGLDHVVLRCTRLAQTLAFYRDVLGCPVERVQADIGLHQLRAGTSLIDLVEVGGRLGGTAPPDPERANVAHLCLALKRVDWDALRAHLEAHGVAWEAPARRYGAGGFGLSTYLADPEGNVVELKGPPED